MNFYFSIGIAYICVLVGMMIGRVGEISSCIIIDWRFPVFMFFLLVFPFIFGYLAGENASQIKLKP